MKPLVYLAGPISGLGYGAATDWRDEATVSLASVGIRGISPMRHKGYLVAETHLASDCDNYAKYSSLSSNKGITTRDRFDCQRADVLLVNLLGATRVSIGTMIELGWADAARIPIVIAMEPTDNVHQHAMVKEVAGFICPTLDEAISIVKHILGD